MPRTSSYRRQQQPQQEEKPEPGTDSTYGVRSLESVADSDWGEGPASDSDRVSIAETTSEVGQDAAASGSELPQPEHPEPGLSGPATKEEYSPDRSLALPTSPYPEGQGRPYSYYALNLDQDGMSEPSSPASFASMPSYISDLSRTSSLAGEARPGAPVQMGGSEELVMPTLYVPGASPALGRTLKQGRGVKVAVLGDERLTGEFITGLSGEMEVVEFAHGIYGVVEEDEIVAHLSTGLTGDDIENRVEAAYATLNGALHPNPAPGAQNQLEGIVVGYAAKSDWIHLVLVLSAEDSMVAALADIVPVLSLAHATSPLLDQSTASRSPPLLSLASIPDPTPRPGAEASSYFTLQSNDTAAPGTSSRPLTLLIQALRSIDSIHSESTAKFLLWRTAKTDLASSRTSHESSSAFEAAPIMPTVARAQGGGEWEANLSRRLAKRRQSTDETPPPRRGGKRRVSTTRRPTKKEPSSCGPLFPFSHSDPSGGKRVGLGDLMEKTFGGLRRSWKWSLVAAAATAFALAVGWNWAKTG